MAAPPTRPRPRIGLAAIAGAHGALPRRRRAPTPEAPDVEVRPMKYFAGDVIASKYELVRLLGEGGMGAVWLAKNLTLDAHVAIKLIRREVATAEAAARLRDEARVAARIDHPSIVRVFDFGESEFKDPFIVMEVVDGEPLGALFDRAGPMPAEDAVQLLLPVASALAAAHAKGIVHRDLKPDNIVVCAGEGGTSIPKVVDFGIAKLREEEGERTPSQAGIVIGSPEYMSPEQARARGGVDERSDVWAFCVVLYEAITGKLPFEGDELESVIAAILTDPPVPCTDLGAGDDELWAILARGLEKPAAMRWPTMKALGKALAQWAIARGFDLDVAGNSIDKQWGNQRDISGVTRTSVGPRTVRPPSAARELVAPEPPASVGPPAPVVPVDLSALDEGTFSPTEVRHSAPTSVVWSPEARPPRAWPRAAAVVVVVAGAAIGGLFFVRADGAPRHDSTSATQTAPEVDIPAPSPAPSAVPPAAVVSNEPRPIEAPTAATTAPASAASSNQVTPALDRQGAQPPAARPPAAQPARKGSPRAMPVPREPDF